LDSTSDVFWDSTNEYTPLYGIKTKRIVEKLFQAKLNFHVGAQVDG
jgi:hypothetical protein